MTTAHLYNVICCSANGLKLLLFVVVLGCSSCGQKGALTLPDGATALSPQPLVSKIKQFH